MKFYDCIIILFFFNYVTITWSLDCNTGNVVKIINNIDHFSCQDELTKDSNITIIVQIYPRQNLSHSQLMSYVPVITTNATTVDGDDDKTEKVMDVVIYPDQSVPFVWTHEKHQNGNREL